MQLNEYYIHAHMQSTKSSVVINALSNLYRDFVCKNKTQGHSNKK